MREAWQRITGRLGGLRARIGLAVVLPAIAALAAWWFPEAVDWALRQAWLLGTLGVAVAGFAFLTTLGTAETGEPLLWATVRVLPSTLVFLGATIGVAVTYGPNGADPSPLGGWLFVLLVVALLVAWACLLEITHHRHRTKPSSLADALAAVAQTLPARAPARQTLLDAAADARRAELP